jgi:ribose 5-phosphate isomerase B
MIYLGADHGGFDLKEKIKKWFTAWGYAWQDMGNTVYEKDDDYPIFAFKVAEMVALEQAKLGGNIPWAERPKGILTCRSATSMMLAANKVKGIRAVTAYSERSAENSRINNDTNILAMAGDFLEENIAQDILKIWLNTETGVEARHRRRMKTIADYENRK